LINNKKAKGYYLDRTGRTIKHINGLFDTEGNAVSKIEDPYIKEEDGKLKIDDTIVVKCDGERCEKIAINDNDFYENSEKNYGNESGTVIQCIEEDPNNKQIQNYSKYNKCTIVNKTLGFYTNTQKELVSCNTSGCTTIEPIAFKEITDVIPRYYINENTINDPENPIIICRYIENVEDHENKGCRYDKPLRGECSNECPDYPITFNNLFVNSGKPMSLISCSIVINGTFEHQSQSYSCNLIDAKDLSYYITSENNSSFVPLKKSSLIECTVITDGYNSCIEFENEKLGLSYYINTINDNKIIDCDTSGCITEIGYNYYIDGCNKDENDEANNIKVNCYKSSSESLISCSGNNCKKSKGTNRGIYIKGDGIGLISYKNEKYKEIDGSDINTVNNANNDIKNNAFINGANEKNDKPVITLNGVKWQSQTAISNNLYLNGNSEKQGSYSFILCSSVSSCNEISGDINKKYIDILSAKIYTYNSEDDKFRYENNMVELLENSMKGFIVYPETMEILEDNLKSGILVVCSDDRTSGPSCTLNGNYMYYLNGVSSKNIINNINGLKFINSPVQGYYVNTKNNIIACDGNDCSFYRNYKECNVNTVGSINNNLELCGKYDIHTGNEIKIKATINGKFMVTISNNMFPGNLVGAYLLQFFNNIIYPIFNEDDVVSFYLISDDLTPVTTLDTTGTLYKCTGKYACEIVNMEGTYPNNDIDTIKTFQHIICYKNTKNIMECTSTIKQMSMEEVYCLSKIQDYYLYVCNGNCNRVDESNTPCRQEIANNGYYIPYYSNQLITCSGPYKCNNDTSILSTYYKSAVLSESLIRCVDSLNKKSCSYLKSNNGFYPSHENGKLLKCIDGICTLRTVGEGYYISGEDNKILITCKKSFDQIICSSIMKAKSGWYRNGDPDRNDTGNILIKCNLSSSESVNSCIESEALNDGYVVNAGSDDTLIDCNTGDDRIKIKDGYYYVNGETRGLLYCIYKNIFNVKYECLNVSIDNYTSYYKINPDNITDDDNKKMIICTKSQICSYYTVNQLSNGYYVNSDTYRISKIYPMIYNDGNIFSLKMSSSRGWYINADIHAEDDEKIIECKNSYSCKRKDIKKVACDPSLNGSFTTFYGDIKWCNNDNEVSLPVDKGKQYNLFVNYENNLIPGLDIKYEKSNDTIVLLNISNDSVLQIIDEDGYSYSSSNNKLYFCIDKVYGICEEDKIIPGYYFNYKAIKDVIRCNSNLSCEIIDYREEINGQRKFSCSNSNIVYNEQDENNKYIKICNDKENGQSLKEFNINLIYALRTNLDNQFPGAINRYALVNVNKYYIKFKQDISELTGECPLISSTNVKDKKKYCLKNEKLYKYTNVFSPYIYSENLQINSENINENIIFDYDTNDGYFIYSYCNNKNDIDFKKSLLIKVYIDNDISKYECVIGQNCIERKKSGVPIVGYTVTDDGVLREKRKDNSDVVVLEKIYESRFLMYKTHKFIKCINGGFCEEDDSNEWIMRYDENKNSINVVVNQNPYESNLLRAIYIFDNNVGSVKKRSINSEYAGLIYELTSVSFKLLQDSKNIFLNVNNELISVEDESINAGYKCFDNSCYKITCGDKDEYYLNTVQEGNPKNAVVKCKNNKFEMIHCSEYTNNIYYENAVARNRDEAIILCSSKSCKITASDLKGKLPLCKLEDNGYVDENSVCIRNDNLTLLNEGQHCIFYDAESNKSKIYVTTKNGKCEQEEETKQNNHHIYIFDVTLKLLKREEIKKTHYSATMYNCQNDDNCYQTYGYVVNDSNSYIQCSSDGCIYYDVSSLKTNCAEAGIGNLINNIKEIMICIDKNKSASLKNSSKYYNLSIKINNSYPETMNGDEILIHNEDGVSSIVIDESYILIDNNNEIIKGINNNNDNILNKCNAKEKQCIILKSPENGYYYSYLMDENNIIECNTNTCISISNTEYNLSFIEGQYLYWKEISEFNKVSFPGNENFNVISFSDGISIRKYKGNDFILLNKNNKLATENESEPLVNLYQCNLSLGNCNKVEKIYDGWYVSGDPNYKAIMCIDEECTMKKELHKSCENDGDFIYNDNIYYICVDNKKYYLDEVSKNSYYFTNNNHSFPNNKNYIVTYSNYVIGIGNISNDYYFKALATCKKMDPNSVCTDVYDNNILEGEYCVNSNKIYRNLFGKCQRQYFPDKSAHVFFKNNLITLTNIQKFQDDLYSLPNGIQMYYCKDDNCIITQGYYKLKSDTIFRCEFIGCKVILTSEQGNKNGDITSITSGEMKYMNGISKMINDHYYYIEGLNNFPGSENLKSFLVEAGDNYYNIFSGNGYYLLNNENLMENTEVFTNQRKRNDLNNTDSLDDLDFSNDTLENKIIQTNIIKNIHTNSTDNYPINKFNNTTESIKQKPKRTESNVLYYCDNIYKNCEIKNTLTGYFVNSGSSSINTALIECNLGNCKITENTKYGINSCNNDRYVKLIRYEKTSYYKLCMNRNEKKAIEIKPYIPTSYHILTLGKNDVFPGFDENTLEKEEINIIIKSSNEGIEQYRNTGYILILNNKIIDVVGGEGYLYHCENKIKYENGPSNIQCQPLTEITNGIYFNNQIFNDKRYIKCIQGKKCMIVEATENSSCNSSGTLIYNNNSHKLCINRDEQLDIFSINHEQKLIMNVDYVDSFPGVKDNNTNIIVSLDDEKVNYMNMTSYLITYNNNNTVIEDNTNEGILHQCNSGICHTVELPNDGFYIYSYDENLSSQLIYCENDSCGIIKNINEGFYVSGDDSKPIIQYIYPGKLINEIFYNDEEISVLCYDRDYKEGWYLNADENKNLIQPMIKCSKEKGCQETSVEYPGWYINNGFDAIYDYGNLSNSIVYPLIKCTSITSCTYYKDSIGYKCTKNGDIIYSSDKNNNSFSLCKNNDETVKFNTINDINYQIINIIHDNDIPGVTEGDNIIRITKYEVVSLVNSENTVDRKYYYKNGNIYSCTINCNKIVNENVIVYDELTKKLLMSSRCKDEICEWKQYDREGYVFIDNDNHLITDTENKSIDKLYRCKNNYSNNLICYSMKDNETGKFPTGYYYNNEILDSINNKLTILYKYNSEENEWTVQNLNELNKCSYYPYKNHTCYISYENEEYYSINMDNLKINSESVCITNQSKLYFTLSEINTGVDDINCIKLPTDNSVNYYNVNNKVYAADKYSFYNVNGNNLMNSLTNKLIDTNKSNFSGMVEQSDNNIDQYTLSCTSGNCVKRKTKYCNYDFQYEQCKSAEGFIKAGTICTSSSTGKIYITLESINKTSAGKCIPYSKNKSMTMTSESFTIEYLDRKYVEYNNQLFYINSESEVHLVDDGLYIIDKWNYKISISKSIEIGSNSEYNIYVCNNGICKKKESCENGQLNEYIFDKLSNTVYQCDPIKKRLNIIDKVGYYLNYPLHDLIQCYIDYNYLFNCVIWDNSNGMEGYYLNTGNNDKIIKCYREEDSFFCSEDDIIECYYNEINEKCHSEIDLLRNSYCIYRDNDSVMGYFEKFIYIENYIRAGDYGNCIVNDNHDYYMKYKRSKFLGHEERNDLIRFSSNSLVSIYEPTTGYYVISTETGQGIESDTPLNKSRMYKCQKQSCHEEYPNNIGNIYVNKASFEKMIRYMDTKWNVIHRRCKIRYYLDSNESQCVLSTSISLGDIVYVSDSINVEFYYVTIDVINDENPTISNPTSDTSIHIRIKNGYYHFIKSDEKLYKLINDGQVFDVQKESGYYIFNTNRNYNMEGYQSSVNRTSDYENYYAYYVHDKNEDFRTELIGNNIFNEEGYYWNKADLESKGVILQLMKVPKRFESENYSISREQREDDIITKFKFLTNKCISTKMNICSTTSSTEQPILMGSSCVVVDGPYRGLYYATKVISYSSKIMNCMKYNDMTLYEYIKETIEFAGEPISKNIIKVDKNSINPFKHNTTEINNKNNYDEGYFVIDDNRVLLDSTTPTSAKAYHCKIEYEKNDNNENILESATYICDTIYNPKNYYYANSQILYSTGKKWYSETKFGYYFYNENNLAATMDTINDKTISSTSIKSVNPLNYGVYINSMVTDKIILINIDKFYAYSFVENIQLCIVKSDGTCQVNTIESQFYNGSYCYNKETNKLYIIEIIEAYYESNTIICHTGSKNDLNYYYNDNTGELYRMDGLSIQAMENGYYILNDKWKEFNSNYPEVPYKIIKCEYYNCEILDNTFNIDSDVVINEAGSFGNKLLKFFKEESEIKFLNAYQPGFYFLNDESEVTINENNPIFTNIYEINEYGNLQKVNDTMREAMINDNIIYINYAKIGIFVRNGKKFKHSLLSYDKEKDILIFDNVFNLSNNITIFKYLNKGTSLYKIKPKMLIPVKEGIYALKNNRVFTDTEWTELNINNEICYYNGEKCNGATLFELMNHKYLLNKASDKISIIEYNRDKDKWRVVKEDGYYFFFEEDYSITRVDRRIEKVIQIIDGVEIDVTYSKHLSGYFIFDGLMIEGNGDAWEDAKSFVDNVDVVLNKQCTSYEKCHIINHEGFCFDNNLGVCVPKKEIEDNSFNNNNCIFSQDDIIKYYYKDGYLFSFNNQMNQWVNLSGIYVIGRSRTPYTSKIERVLKAYSCNKNHCESIQNLDSQYYLNMANMNDEHPVILRYQNSTKEWNKTIKDGYYFFNEKGYPVSENEEAVYYYSVKNNGNTVENIKNHNQKGIYVSQSNPYQEIVMINNGTWTKAIRVPKCQYNNSNCEAISEVAIKEGNVCLDGK